MRRRWLILTALTVLALGWVPGIAAADPPPGLEMEAEAAFDGYFKYGEWLPVWVLLENSGPDLDAEVRLRVTGGWGATTFAAPAPLPTGSRKRIPIYVLPNNYSHELDVQLVEGNEIRLSQQVSLNPSPNLSYLVGLVAPQRGALSFVLGASLPGQERPKKLIDLSLAELPERPEGLRSFDCLILNDVDTSTLTPEQGAALEAWVRQGGRLVIGGGAGAMRTVAGLPESLLSLALRGEVEVDALPGLADFTGAEAVRVPGLFVAALGELRGGRALAAQSESDPSAGDLPGLLLVQERTIGAGNVDFVALDLAVSPFDAWTGTTAFWEKLLAPGATYPAWLPPDMSSRQMYAGQMSYALSNLPSLDLPSIRGLGILLILYVILVGPVNYLVLRWRKRLHWAWLTIPLMTLAFSAGAFGLGYALRGTDLILNEIAVVELQPDGVAGVSSYLGLFSPARQSYEIEVTGGGLISPLNPDYNPWGPGGISTTAGEMIFLQGDPGRVRGLAVNQWSMQTFMAEGMWADLGRVVSDLWVENEALVGIVRNETTRTLTGVAIVLGNNFIRLGDLAPGEEKPVTMALSGLTDQRFGPPVSWRLFEEELNSAAAGGGAGVPSREAELKRSVVDSVFQQGGKLSPVSSVRFWGGRSAPQGLVLLGWLDEALPEVRVAGRKPAQQTTAMLYTLLPYRLAGQGQVSLPPGLIPGALVELPREGGPCGPDTVSVYIGRGQAILDFRLPPEILDVRVETLDLLLGSDGGWWQSPEVTVYDWDAGAWVSLDEPVLGVNMLADADGLVSDDGLVRVRLASESGSGGCLYVELGLKGSR